MRLSRAFSFAGQFVVVLVGLCGLIVCIVCDILFNTSLLDGFFVAYFVGLFVGFCLFVPILFMFVIIDTIRCDF